MKHSNKIAYSILVLILLGTCYFAGVFTTKYSYEWSWSRSAAEVDRLPITKSTTCKFKKSFVAEYTYNNEVKYSQGVEQESDTVSFLNLDSERPLIQTTGGEGQMTVLSNSKDKEVLLNLGSFGNVDLYTLYKDSGVIFHTNHVELVVPMGTMEVGFCS